jgi:hypothetical protein
VDGQISGSVVWPRDRARDLGGAERGTITSMMVPSLVAATDSLALGSFISLTRRFRNGPRGLLALK